MDYKPKKTDEELLQRGKSTFEAAVLSYAYQTWFDQAVESFEFYEGKQFTDQELDKFNEIGLKPYVINQVANRIDGFVGKDVQTRTKIKFTSRSGNLDEQATADALTDLAWYVQDKNKSPALLSECKRNSAVCGLGWHYYTVVDKDIREASLNPLEVVWDARDRTPNLSNQGFLATIDWMDIESAKLEYPDHADELDKAGTQAEQFLGFGVSLTNAFSQRMQFLASQGYWNKELRQVMVVKLQYRVADDYYIAITKEGKQIATFEKDEAEKLNDNKLGELIKERGWRVCEIHFCGSIFLDHREIEQFDPAKGQFTLTPFCANREKVTGVPYGLMRRMIDPQRLYNLKQNKLNWTLGAAKIIMDKDAVDDINELATEAAKPDGIIMKNAGKELIIDQGQNITPQLFEAIGVHKGEIEQVSGIYDEMLGIQTNATSGVAIKNRQMASQTTQVFLMDKWNEARFLVAEKLLGLMRATYTDQVAMMITDDEGEAKQISLNQTTVKDGKDTEVYNDIRVGRYNIAIDESPDVSTANEDARQKILDFAQAFKIMPEQLTTGMLDFLGVPKTSTWYKEVAAQVQQKVAQANQLQDAQQQAQSQQITATAQQGAAGMAGGPSPVSPNNVGT